MASADLDYIRALLIAQTAEPEPPARSLFSRLRGSDRARRPLTLGEPSPVARQPADPHQEILLEAICGSDLHIETASPLPPPPPRDAFGRRTDAITEIELMLDRPAVEARRLRVLDISGAPIGEMILHRDNAGHAVYSTRPLHDDANAAPYFPEDLMEPPAAREPQPLRPWIKALRGAGPNGLPPPSTTEASLGKADTRPPAKRIRNRRPAKTTAGPKLNPSLSLGRDLLAALALSLTREHESLSDRLLAVASERLFQPETTPA